MQGLKIVDCGDAPLTVLDNTIALRQLERAHKVCNVPYRTLWVICGWREDFGIGIADGYKRLCLLEGRIRQSLLSRGLLLSAVRKQMCHNCRNGGEYLLMDGDD